LIKLRRRGFNLGLVDSAVSAASQNSESEYLPPREQILASWESGRALLLNQLCLKQLSEYAEQLVETEYLVAAILNEQSCDELLYQSPFRERLEPKFQSLGSTFNEGDEQEIEMVVFDALENGSIIAEDLWLKASWLSFHDEDASLRFRFSFGNDHEEDVAADAHRQTLAGELSDAVFPESEIVCENHVLQKILSDLLDDEKPKFVERIVYFNAPNGGAYLHHDLERGHAGVVYTQLSGETFWLALPKRSLIEEIIAFSKTHPWPESMTREMRSQMNDLISDRSLLSEQLGSFNNNTLIHLINETEAFVQFLIAKGHSHHLVPGDTLLLPQASADACCWHSVFCVGEEMGQALSFAIRAE